MDSFIDEITPSYYEDAEDNAKQCAIIAVNGMIEEIRDYGDDNYRQVRMNYLQEVKSETEKL